MGENGTMMPCEIDTRWMVDIDLIGVVGGPRHDCRGSEWDVVVCVELRVAVRVASKWFRFSMGRMCMKRVSYLKCAIAVGLSPLFVGCSGMAGPKVYDEAVDSTSLEWTYGRSKGTKQVSEHYAIHTTCTRRPFVSALPGFMEACYHGYTKLLPTAAEPTEPMDTYLFQSRGDWERFTEEFAPTRADTYKKIRRGGYSERGVTVSHYSTQRATLSIMAHEGLHQFLEVTGRGRIPAWINEGLACYFESFDVIGDRPVFLPEKNTLRSPSMRDALVRDDLIPLEEILGTNAGEAVHQKSSHVRSYYAQEWSLVLFLLSDDAPAEYRDGFRALLVDLGTPEMERKAQTKMASNGGAAMSPGEAVFRAYITDDLQQFDAKYRLYLVEVLGLHT